MYQSCGCWVMDSLRCRVSQSPSSSEVCESPPALCLLWRITLQAGVRRAAPSVTPRLRRLSVRLSLSSRRPSPAPVRMRTVSHGGRPSRMVLGGRRRSVPSCAQGPAGCPPPCLGCDPVVAAPSLPQALPQAHSAHVGLLPLFIEGLAVGATSLREFVLPAELPLCHSLRRRCHLGV